MSYSEALTSLSQLERIHFMVKKLKIWGIVIMCCTIGIVIILLIMMQKKDVDIYEDNGLKYMSKVEGKDFYIYADGEWEKKFLKGVNIGAAKPGHFPGELAITKDEYLRWFQYISDMNAEVIRAYTTLNPAFYDALYEFNKNSKKPLYLIQGVWKFEIKCNG